MRSLSRSTVYAMITAAVVTAQFVAGKATRDALFLTSVDFTALPVMLIAASAGKRRKTQKARDRVQVTRQSAISTPMFVVSIFTMAT